MKTPDVNKHFIISCIKSGLRITSCILAIQHNEWRVIASGFVIAELLGVVEELL